MKIKKFLVIASVFANLALLFLVVFLLKDKSTNFNDHVSNFEPGEGIPQEQASSPAILGEVDSSTSPKSSESVLVTKVIDGDTIVLESGEVVRYIGIDTPEKGGECYSRESTSKNEELVAGKLVRLEKDISEKDRYGRLLRYVWADDIFVNDYLVREGYATSVSYPPDVKYQELFRDAQRDASANNRGLWSECDGKTLQITQVPKIPREEISGD